MSFDFSPPVAYHVYTASIHHNPERENYMNSPFKSLVLAGGGNRCLWQCGFLKEVIPAAGLAPEVVAGASAGATMACTVFSGRLDYALAYMKYLMAGNPKNFYWRNLFNGAPVFPHQAMYRDAVLTVIGRDGLQQLKSGPDIRVLLARPPRWAGPRLAVLTGFVCYALEKKLRHPVHSEWSSRAGFRPQVVSVRQCETPGQLADLLLASSCTPPVTPVLSWEGAPVLDGGLVDNVPLLALGGAPGPTLILLTRHYPADRIPRVSGRLYVQPSQPVPVSKWDYTNPEGIQDAFDRGRRDGERFLARFDREMEALAEGSR